MVVVSYALSHSIRLTNLLWDGRNTGKGGQAGSYMKPELHEYDERDFYDGETEDEESFVSPVPLGECPGRRVHIFERKPNSYARPVATP